MKLTIFIPALLLCTATFGQNVFYVFIDRPALSVSQSELKEAETFDDIHSRFRDEWVAEYLSTEIAVSNDGQTAAVPGEDDQVTTAQKKLLLKAPVGASLTVSAQYIPKNNLKDNPPREMDFTYEVVPAVSATFKGGETASDQYLQQSLFSKLDTTQENQLKIARAEFDVLEDGSIANIELTESCEDSKIDKLILQSLRNMPNWIPAKQVDGKAVNQRIKVVLSNTMGNCLIYAERPPE